MKRIMIGLFASALPAIVLAASHDLKTFIGEYDADGNGSVSKEEFAAGRDKRFAATDVDHDGGLSGEEYAAEFKARLATQKPEPEVLQRQLRQLEVRFKVLDSNKDGKISPAEYASSGWNMFTHHDANKDGAVSIEDEAAKKEKEDKEDAAK